MDDAKVLFAWRNNPTTYEHFLNPEPVEWDGHVAWLESVIANPERPLYIILNEMSESIGQVRFDKEGNEAEISITIGEDFRGKGYGSRSITESINVFFSEFPDTNKIVALVKQGNAASARAFLKVGFKEEKTDDGMMFLTYSR